MRIVLEPFGDRAWRARLPEEYDLARRRRLLETLRALPRIADVVVSERHALVVLEPGTPLESMREAVATAVAGGHGETTPHQEGGGLAEGKPRRAEGVPRDHEIEVRYDGADLVEVARASGLSPDEVTAMHTECTYEVAMMGFLPGFAYLRSLRPRLVLPRRATPRAWVPARSVAIAGPYTAVYPFASPGGWHLLGVAVSFVPFDAGKGAAMELGDRVRFVPSAVVPSPRGPSAAPATKTRDGAP